VYEGHTIFTIPVENRQLRIAQLGYDTIAASNMPTTEQIHAMLDRYRSAASPFSGSSLLATWYRDVPLLSTAWGMGHIALPIAENGHVQLFGLELPLSEDTTFIASLRLGVGAVHLRVEQIAPTEADAAASAQVLTTIVQLIQAVPPQVAAAQSDTSEADQIRELTSSIKVEQHHDRAVLTASLPLDLLRKLAQPVSGGDFGASSGGQAPAAAPVR
jgi:hypothetical protein